MIDFLVGLMRDTPLGQILTVTEAVSILLGFSTALVVFVTVVLGGGAVSLRARKDALERARDERFSEWQEALHLVLYDGEKASTLLELVAPREGIDFLNFLLLYVRRLDGDERAGVCALAQPYLPEIFQYLNHRAEGHRVRAVQTVGELGLPQFGEQVIAALEDPSPMVVMVAASTLARAETPEYAAEILTHFDRFAHWRRDFLASMLSSMGSRATPALRATLGDPDAASEVRAVAADALATLADPLAADVAHEILTTRSETELRAACLRVLASVGRDEHLDVVREHLTAVELGVRLAAVRALGRFGVAADLTPLDVATKEDPSPWVAIAAARALKESGGGEALVALAGSEHPRSALGLQVLSEARSW